MTAGDHASDWRTCVRLAVGGDHAGFPLKGPVIAALRSWGHEVEDLGAHSPEPVDFPDITRAVCQRIQDGLADRAVLVCGTGVGACIAANKIRGIRAALCHDVHSAHQAVEHDDVNVICIGAGIVGEWLALDLVRTFIDATYDDVEPYRTRLRKLAELEAGNLT